MVSNPEPKFKKGDVVFVSNSNIIFTVTNIQIFTGNHPNQTIGYEGPYKAGSSKTTFWFEFCLRPATKLHKALS